MLYIFLFIIVVLWIKIYILWWNKGCVRRKLKHLQCNTRSVPPNCSGSCFNSVRLTLLRIIHHMRNSSTLEIRLAIPAFVCSLVSFVTMKSTKWQLFQASLKLFQIHTATFSFLTRGFPPLWWIIWLPPQNQTKPVITGPKQTLVFSLTAA